MMTLIFNAQSDLHPCGLSARQTIHFQCIANIRSNSQEAYQINVNGIPYISRSEELIFLEAAFSIYFLTSIFDLKGSFPNLCSILVSKMVCLANFFFKQVHTPPAFTLLYTLLESYDKDLMTKNIE